MSPASYQTAPPRDVSFRYPVPGPILRVPACYGTAWICSATPDSWRRYSDERLAWSGPCGFGRLCFDRAGNGTRTRDPNLGKVVLYQLSYSREAERILVSGWPRRNDPRLGVIHGRRGSDGGEGDRTPDLVNAIHALSQLSYAPVPISRPRMAPRQHGNVARALTSVNEVRDASEGYSGKHD